jgi:hypothetical protein
LIEIRCNGVGAQERDKIAILLDAQPMCGLECRPQARCETCIATETRPMLPRHCQRGRRIEFGLAKTLSTMRDAMPAKKNSRNNGR